MSSSYPSIDRLADVQQLIINLSKVERVMQFGDTGRKENDVDHSYGLALTCWYLAPKIAPQLDLEKIFKYALAHDMVEIQAGDTFVFGDSKEIDDKADREAKAIKQLYKDWPDFTEMVDATKGYDDKIDEEAKFVKAVDKFIPLIIIDQGEGSEFWNRHKITLDMMRKNKVTIKVSDYIAPYYDKILDWLEERDNMHKTNQATS
jgi:putative hydrolases of HD superfamily